MCGMLQHVYLEYLLSQEKNKNKQLNKRVRFMERKSLEKDGENRNGSQLWNYIQTLHIL